MMLYDFYSRHELSLADSEAKELISGELIGLRQSIYKVFSFSCISDC